MSERIAPESVLAGAFDDIGDLGDLQDPGLGQVQDPVQNTTEWGGKWRACAHQRASCPTFRRLWRGVAV